MRAQQAAPLPWPRRLRDHPTNRGRPPVAPYSGVSRVHIVSFVVREFVCCDNCMLTWDIFRQGYRRRIKYGVPRIRAEFAEFGLLGEGLQND